MDRLECDLQLIHKDDVQAAEYVFQELGGLRDATTRNRYDGLDRTGIKLHGLLETCRRQTSDEFRHLTDFAVRVCGVFALWRESQMEVLAGHETRARLKNGPQIQVDGAGVGRRFQDNECALADMRGDGAPRLEDIKKYRARDSY